jgi:RNA polymerase sigma factor (sigma-70 family)
MTDRRSWLAEEFEVERPHLRAIAYRMLGSLTEADDAVQEAWVRLDRKDPGGEELRGWLTVVVGRICLDLLRARRTHHVDYQGSWLPEPIVSLAVEENPEAEAVMADSVGLALLVVLDTLTPAERLSFVLHDVFGLPFDEVATVVGRSSAASRQLASRARRRVRQGSPEPDADLVVQRKVVDAFLVAARSGDLGALLEILDPDVVFRSDGGGAGPLARPTVTGALAVARQAQIFGARFAEFARRAVVNGSPGAIVRVPGPLLIVAGFTVARGRIAAIDLIADPAKLGGLDALTDLRGAD